MLTKKTAVKRTINKLLGNLKNHIIGFSIGEAAIRIAIMLAFEAGYRQANREKKEKFGVRNEKEKRNSIHDM